MRTKHGWESHELKLEGFYVAPCAEAPGLPYLVPGLVDTHCHGANSLDVMAGKSEAIAKYFQSIGIEWFLPTTVTSSWEAIRSAMDAVTDATGIPGFHLEGPFISPDRLGAQPAQFALPADPSVLERELGDRISKVRVMTLAPELEGAFELIKFLHDHNIIVSVGHSCSNFETLCKAKSLGVDRMTHFYNAMSPLHHRDLGCVGYGLLNRPKCELIYDRVHVSRAAAALLIASIGKEKLIGVSDGTVFSHLPDGAELELWGHRASVRDGAVRLPDGTLCGSCCTLIEIFVNLWADFGPDVAVNACCTNPRLELGLKSPQMWLLVSPEGGVEEVLSGNLLYEA